MHIPSIMLKRITTVTKIHSNLSSNNIVLNLIFSLNKIPALAYLLRQNNKLESKGGYPRCLEIREGRNGCLVSLYGVLPEPLY